MLLLTLILTFAFSSDTWIAVYSDDNCKSIPFWTQRIISEEECVPSDCSDGAFGKQITSCYPLDTTGLCKLHKFSNSSEGRSCNPGEYFSDGYSNPSLCSTCTSSEGIEGYCKWVHKNSEPDHLKYTFFSDSNCSTEVSIMTDYVKDSCVIDFLNDPDVFVECDDWTENWIEVFSGPGCTGDIIWTQRNEINGECVEVDCFDGAFGPTKVSCSAPELDGLCLIKKYDKSSASGLKCNDRAYIGDGYADPNVCVDYRNMSMGYCKFVHEVDHLLFNCYSDEKCTNYVQTFTDYEKDVCTIDFMSDPDIFVECYDKEIYSWVATYSDDQCTKQSAIRRETQYTTCSESSCTKVGSVYEKTTCKEPENSVWMIVYGDSECKGTPVWTQRISTNDECVEQECFTGGFGPTAIQCNSPSLAGLCHIKKYDATEQGKECGEGNYVSDGYANPSLCTVSIEGSCKFSRYSDNVDSLLYECFTDEKCSKGKQVVSEYVRDTCVIDHLNDADVFVDCDDFHESWVLTYSDNTCSGKPIFIQRVDHEGECVAKECTESENEAGMVTLCSDDKPDLKKLCKLKKYDKTEGGLVCADRGYFSDGYVNLVECADWSAFNMGFCKWENDGLYLRIKCYSDSECTSGETVVNEYIQDTCVIDSLGDPDVFDGCDGVEENNIWKSYYSDSECKNPVEVEMDVISGECSETTDCTPTEGDMFYKTSCSAPMNEQWTLIFSGDDCSGDPIWKLRSSIVDDCVESECYDGSMGKEIIKCESQDIVGMCHLKKFDHGLGGMKCEADNYNSDGYAELGVCQNFVKAGLGYCQWKLLGDSQNILKFLCYTDEKCTKGETKKLEYLKDTCVIDGFGDPDIFTGCDSWSENWFMLYSNEKCEGIPIWIQRNEINGNCVESDCQLTDSGYSKIQCDSPSLSNTCKVKKYDKTSGGRICSDRNYIGDGFANPTLCTDYTSSGMGYCRWVHDVAHLKFNCYSDVECSQDEVCYTDYKRDECTLDFLGDNDVFVGCNDNNLTSTSWTTYYADSKCTKPFWTSERKNFGGCMSQTTCTYDSSSGIYYKTVCNEPVFNERRCLVRNFDKNTTGGLQCNSNFNIGNGYGVLGQCIDFSKSGFSYCQLKQSKDLLHLYFYCYSDEKCTKDENLITDYEKDKCVVDHFGDPDSFVFCDQQSSSSILTNGIFVGVFIWLAVSFVLCCLIVLVLFSSLIFTCGKIFGKNGNELDSNYKKLEEKPI